MIQWLAGHNSYKSHTLSHKNGIQYFTTELLDVPTQDYNNIHEVFCEHVKPKQTKTVEVLLSGGMDSEAVLRSLQLSNVPVRAVTGRFIVNGYPVNTHDLYYAEKFCRENNIEHKIVDLDVRNFFENGDHVKYIKPYEITYAHVAIHMWLFEQCTGFPVFGGEYSWPWRQEPVISPHRLSFMCYDRFLQDNNIHGVGSMLGHSLESNMMFIKNHLNAVRSKPDGYYRGEDDKITILKQVIFEDMGFGKLELRMKNYGWEMVDLNVFHIHKYTDLLREELKIDDRDSISEITWGNSIAQVLGGTPGSNCRR